MEDNQKKGGQQKTSAKRGRTLAGIIVLIILGLVGNRFMGDEGKETGQDNYLADVTITGAPTQALLPEEDGEPSGSGEMDKPDKAPSGTEDKDEPDKAPSGTDGEDGKGEPEADDKDGGEIEILYEFRRESYLEQHFDKHGNEFDYATKEEYLEGANRVIQSPDALHKIEAEDGDDIYYLEETNEFVVVSTDGYIRTYFRPSAGINYYNRQ